MRFCAGFYVRRYISAALLLVAVGCTMSHKVAVNDDGVPQYGEMHVSYRIPGSHRAITQHVNGVVGVSAENDSSSHADADAALLRIEYPHPQNKPDMARATLRISNGQTAEEKPSIVGRVKSSMSWLPGTEPPPKVSASAADEVWQFDVPRYQLDLLLTDLAQGGFFDDINRHEGTVYLDVEIDRGSVAKTWSPEARLDDLVYRIQREGFKVGSRSAGERRASSR